MEDVHFYKKKRYVVSKTSSTISQPQTTVVRKCFLVLYSQEHTTQFYSL